MWFWRPPRGRRPSCTALFGPLVHPCLTTVTFPWEHFFMDYGQQSLFLISFLWFMLGSFPLEATAATSNSCIVHMGMWLSFTDRHEALVICLWELSAAARWAVSSSVAYPIWLDGQLCGCVIAWLEGEAIKNVQNCIHFGLSMKMLRGRKNSPIKKMPNIISGKGFWTTEPATALPNSKKVSAQCSMTLAEFVKPSLFGDESLFSAGVINTAVYSLSS